MRIPCSFISHHRYINLKKTVITLQYFFCLILISAFSEPPKLNWIKIKYINCGADFPNIGAYDDFEITPNYRLGGQIDFTSTNFKDSFEFFLATKSLVPDSLPYSRIYQFDPSIYVRILNKDTSVYEFHISRVGYVLFKGNIYFPDSVFNKFVCKFSEYRGCFCR